MAWRLTNDEVYALITYEDNELGEEVADPEAADFAVGVYAGEDYSDAPEVHGLSAAVAWCEAAVKNPTKFLEKN